MNTNRKANRIMESYYPIFEMDFSYRNPEPGLVDSVVKLQAWYVALEERRIDRGPNFSVPPHIQMEIYKEALLIFYGKVSVYPKALEKVPSKQWQEWIA